MGLNRFGHFGRKVAMSTLAATYFICIWAQNMLFQGGGWSGGVSNMSLGDSNQRIALG
jgi:hypothetical protein